MLSTLNLYWTPVAPCFAVAATQRHSRTLVL